MGTSAALRHHKGDRKTPVRCLRLPSTSTLRVRCPHTRRKTMRVQRQPRPCQWVLSRRDLQEGQFLTTEYDVQTRCRKCSFSKLS